MILVKAGECEEKGLLYQPKSLSAVGFHSLVPGTRHELLCGSNHLELIEIVQKVIDYLMLLLITIDEIMKRSPSAPIVSSVGR